MDASDPLSLRRQARAAAAEKEAALIALHRRAADALAGPEGGVVRQAALTQIAKWEAGHLCSPHYIALWRGILSLPADAARAAMLEAAGEGPALRQNTPFGFLSR